MINYIINFVICSGLLLLVYRAFLGTENLYRFNRFYLLFSLVFSLAVPATTIHVPYVTLPAWDKLIANKPAAVIADRHLTEQAATRQMPTMVDGPLQPQTAAPIIIGANNNADDYAITTSIPQAAISVPAHHDIAPTPHSIRNYLPEILLALYGAVTLLLLLRFIRNSYHITRVVAGSTIIDYQDTKLVLVTDDVTPHSFLKYVFLNKAAYYNKTIEPEIICHEQTHVRQLHSLDVIWIELLQIVFWFNFFIPLYRKAIQLNHEFLADEAVIENYQDTPAYQHLLLAKASQSGSLYLTSQFNYLVTKKRIIMMTKRTTAAIALYKQLALLPVLVAAIFLFSQKIMAQTTPKAKPVNKPKAAPKVTVKPEFNTTIEAAKQDAPQRLLDEYSTILAKYHIPYKAGEKINYTPEFAAADKERLTTLYKQMSIKQQEHQYIRLVYMFPPPILRFTQKDLVTWQNNTGYIVCIDDKQIKNADLAKYKVTDFRSVEFKQQPVPSAKDGWHWKVTLMTPAYYKAYVETLPKVHLIYIPKKRWKSINRHIGGATDASAEAQVIPAEQMPGYANQDAPQSVLDEYAVILKKYNFPPDISKLKWVGAPKHKILGTPNFSSIDKELLVNLFKQMSYQQQEQQWVIFIKSGPPLPRVSLSEAGLNKMKNPKEYGVWVDEKKINNAELNKYKATDFDQVFISKLTTAALHHTEYRYQADLMTKAYYARYYKENKAKETKYYAMAHIPGINKNAIQFPQPGNRATPTQTNDQISRRPMIVVDGKAFEKPVPANFDFNTADNTQYASLLSLPLSDIATITVLTDADTKKIWGERAANGVLLIRTKHGG